MVEWPAPVSRKHVRFLGFANFYRSSPPPRSLLCGPLTRTLLSSPSSNCSPQPQFSFTRIHRFSSWWRWTPRTLEWGPCFLNGPQRITNFIPVLFFLDALHLQREMLTSATGSCWQWLCRSGGIGWRALLCLSLSGQIIKNLAYLRSAKRLNSRQAQWALFLDQFDYTLTYCPGSRNAKPDALSRQSDRETFKPENILPASCIVAAVSWRVGALVKQAQHTQPDPGNGPPNRLFVPDSARSQVLQWAHTSKITCHPGFQRTLEFLRRKFWWPTMAKGTRAYIPACSVCARNKSSHQ